MYAMIAAFFKVKAEKAEDRIKELEADYKMLKDLAIDAANELEFHHPNSDIPDRLEKIL